jgi:hypothetical protein
MTLQASSSDTSPSGVPIAHDFRDNLIIDRSDEPNQSAFVERLNSRVRDECLISIGSSRLRTRGLRWLPTNTNSARHVDTVRWGIVLQPNLLHHSPTRSTVLHLSHNYWT